MGETDAWRLMHQLGWYPYGGAASTMTLSLDAGEIDKVPEEMRWRKLTREELGRIKK